MDIKFQKISNWETFHGNFREFSETLRTEKKYKLPWTFFSSWGWGYCCLLRCQSLGTVSECPLARRWRWQDSWTTEGRLKGGNFSGFLVVLKTPSLVCLFGSLFPSSPMYSILHRLCVSFWDSVPCLVLSPVLTILHWCPYLLGPLSLPIPMSCPQYPFTSAPLCLSLPLFPASSLVLNTHPPALLTCAPVWSGQFATRPESVSIPQAVNTRDEMEPRHQ